MKWRHMYVTPWSPWFAWRPVTLYDERGQGYTVVWFHWVLRRRCGVVYEHKEWT